MVNVSPGNASRPWATAAVLLAAGLLASGGRGVAARDERPKTSGWVESSKEEPAGTHYHTFHSKAVGGEVSYLLYLPPGYDDDKGKRFPAVYWLHGLANDQRHGAGFVRRLDAAIKDGRAPATIAVLVNGRTHSLFCDSPDGKTPVESMIVKDLIPHVDETYRTLARRDARAVEGFSMGGFGAAHLGFKYPETFGLVSILAGSMHKAEDFAERDSKAFREAFGGDKKYFEKNSPWTLLADNAGEIRRNKVRVRVVVGDEDGLFGGNKQFHDRMDRKDVDNDFRVVKGVGHDYQKLYDGMGDEGFTFYKEGLSIRSDKNSD
ncbi:MAG: esterase family protein [Planctomycetia bacterium]|nr:esterase family protein [Planctomycetia bacterium]